VPLFEFQSEVDFARLKNSDGVPGAIGAMAAKQRTLAARNDAHPAAFLDGSTGRSACFRLFCSFAQWACPYKVEKLCCFYLENVHYNVYTA